jgi:hypothetical protein
MSPENPVLRLGALPNPFPRVVAFCRTFHPLVSRSESRYRSSGRIGPKLIQSLNERLEREAEFVVEEVLIDPLRRAPSLPLPDPVQRGCRAPSRPSLRCGLACPLRVSVGEAGLGQRAGMSSEAALDQSLFGSSRCFADRPPLKPPGRLALSGARVLECPLT